MDAMQTSVKAAGPHLSAFAAAFALSGLCFLLYPAVRPFSSETGKDGARAFGSSSWIVAHSLGIAAFALLALGAFGLYVRLQDTSVGERMVRAVVLIWVGVALTLPYYGAEVFGLHAVGQRALAGNEPALVKPLTHSIRWEAGIYFIVAGLLLLALGAIVMARAVWRSGRLQRWSALPLAAGLLLYIPQFSAPQSIRIVHGMLMLAGCWWLAWNIAAPRKARIGGAFTGRRALRSSDLERAR
jgi:hypothetical protein